MTSRLTTSAQIGFRARHFFLNYTGCTDIGQSICNISEISNRKTHPQFENIHQGGEGVRPFLNDFSLKFRMSYLL